MKKKIAPVIITIVVSLLIILWACTGLRETAGLDGFPSAGLLSGIGGVGVLVAVLFIRLKEIDHEDEDDLKKY